MAQVKIAGYSDSEFRRLMVMDFLVDINFTNEEVFLEYLSNGFIPEKWEARPRSHGNKVYVDNVRVTKDKVVGKKNDNGKLPYYTVMFKQFPLALREVIKCSYAGHEKYKETDKDWQNFSRLENAETRYKDASLRHMTETGVVEDMIEFGEMTHEGAVIWNQLADLEIKLRNNG